MKIKVISFPFLTFAIFVFSMCIVYSCTVDEYDCVEDNSKTKVTTRVLETSSNKDLLLDSIAESDVFLDYMISLQLLSDKFALYYSTLNEEERELLAENLNNDDLIKDIVEKSGVKKELEEVIKAGEVLHSDAAYRKLNQMDKALLFGDYFDTTRTYLIKTRDEGQKRLECQRALETADMAADTKWTEDLDKCYDDYKEPGEARQACFLQANERHMNTKIKNGEDFRRCCEGLKSRP